MGTAQVNVSRPNIEEQEKLGLTSWPIWTKEVSTFDWHYDDEETCFFLEGEVVVSTKEGQVTLSAGDLVNFPKGLSCTWSVSKPVRKHYRFGAGN